MHINVVVCWQLWLFMHTAASTTILHNVHTNLFYAIVPVETVPTYACYTYVTQFVIPTGSCLMQNKI